ncbi:MAG TPA: pyruvate kinase [Burkholderiaceae bacterium]|nr:pyruvate kinase [Burkholderiaceae bacterium]
MRRHPEPVVDDGWDAATCGTLIEELSAIRKSLLDHERTLRSALASVDSAHAASARNLVHYLALRRFDLRPLQERLARLGVSSLGRAESHVLANLDKVLGILHRLAGRPWESHSRDEPAGIRRSQTLLDLHTQALLGPPPAGRRVRIMVTMPSEAALDYGLAKKLVAAGMDVARINCAHDGAAEWRAMAALVRRAAHAAGRRVRILMDLGGPKVRTAALAPGPAVLKLRPQRDEFGRVLEPARLGLRCSPSAPTIEGAKIHATAEAGWLEALRAGDVIRLTDARGSRRKFVVEHCEGGGALLESRRTTYLVPGTDLEHRHHGAPAVCRLADLPRRPGFVLLGRGDVLHLTRPERVADAPGHARARKRRLAIGCSLPEVFAQVLKGERIWFDDGRIGGVVRNASPDELEIEITDAREGGEKLAVDKGINLPDSQLDLPALTAQDRDDLAVAVECADLVGLSFAQAPTDVDELRARMNELGAGHLGIVLKVETRRGFDNLPGVLLAAMKHGAAGVMIARGDLAVECGYERLAEVQEEILWACEAAHIPVIWATQVLESLAKTGRPSRSEITDAAMSERAECVMLNKGPFILDAMRTLDDILRRMQTHLSKKRPLLRALRSWQENAAVTSGGA